MLHSSTKSQMGEVCVLLNIPLLAGLYVSSPTAKQALVSSCYFSVCVSKYLLLPVLTGLQLGKTQD